MRWTLKAINKVDSGGNYGLYEDKTKLGQWLWKMIINKILILAITNVTHALWANICMNHVLTTWVMFLWNWATLFEIHTPPVEDLP